MPLIMLCGYPSSGKTTRALQIKGYFEEEKKLQTVLISDDDFLRNEVYSDSKKEKEFRSSLKSSVERELSHEKVVILDSSNYIKGYRYELYCLSKAHKTTNIVIHCDVLPETALNWNEKSENKEKYTKEVFDALVLRFEMPDSKNRWDSPLFTIHAEENLPFEDIYNSAVLRKPPPANQSTQIEPLKQTDFLYELDKRTKNCMQAILEAQKTSLPGDEITIPESSEKLILNKKLTAMELSRLKRQFITYSKLNIIGDAEKVVPMFVQYLNKST